MLQQAKDTNTLLKCHNLSLVNHLQNNAKTMLNNGKFVA